MRESLIVTWDVNYLCLNRIPTEGIWEKPVSDFLFLDLPRPSRADRLIQAPSKETLTRRL